MGRGPRNLKAKSQLKSGFFLDLDQPPGTMVPSKKTEFLPLWTPPPQPGLATGHRFKAMFPSSCKSSALCREKGPLPRLELQHSGELSMAQPVDLVSLGSQAGASDHLVPSSVSVSVCRNEKDNPKK